jgi:hypothetical protein
LVLADHLAWDAGGGENRAGLLGVFGITANSYLEGTGSGSGVEPLRGCSCVCLLYGRPLPAVHLIVIVLERPFGELVRINSK